MVEGSKFLSWRTWSERKVKWEMRASMGGGFGRRKMGNGRLRMENQMKMLGRVGKKVVAVFVEFISISKSRIERLRRNLKLWTHYNNNV